MRALTSIALLALAAGCIGTTPEEELENQQGDDEAEEGPTHRPGQPCLACHGADHTPGGEVFILAGTVYRRAADAAGLAGAEVEVTDDRGEVFAVVSNQAGNFMVSIGEVDEDERNQGWLGVPSAPAFPLHLKVSYGGAEQVMRNVVHREGSCAACHDRAGPGAASAGKVFVEETP